MAKGPDEATLVCLLAEPLSFWKFIFCVSKPRHHVLVRDSVVVNRPSRPNPSGCFCLATDDSCNLKLEEYHVERIRSWRLRLNFGKSSQEDV